MADPDPFHDQAFLGRLGKLMAMLGSEQPGEAEAARRKLLDHLNQHRLSLNDVSNRLSAPPPGLTASFGGGGREATLERELRATRQSHAQLEMELREARQRVYDAEVSGQQMAVDLERLDAGRFRLRAVTGLASAAALLCGLALVVRTLPAVNGRDRVPAITTTSRVLPSDPVTDAERNPAAGQRLGHVAVQDLAVRLNPSDEAGVRTFLNEGAEVVILRDLPRGPQTWLLIRSESGEGWVRAGDILH